ncbi:accessory Sec system translocase SecA2 [Bacillus lacus]|uniref:Protein translocase subunit SecA n=1 Tax=Metabacillus lacus TaxID=1983721 RepID=A0A7X2IZ49_9BACI|nr:accessory Sec system translocase SecA2 [Metabacillus lacus]MRX72162.1 accessory Sec system translocase SecA2 [Metabacillus lacus]
MSKIYDKYMEIKSRSEIKKLYKIVDAINNLEPRFSELSDEQLQEKTAELKAAVKEGKSLKDIRTEAFALVREASKRTTGLRHYDVQLIGGLVLSDLNIAQMQTGEGKTLVSSLPSFLFALEGKGVHVITSNEYLAKRDYELIGQIHRFLGLEVGLNLSKMETSEKQLAYSKDITYGTGNEFGFDYLRDNMVMSESEKVQRGQAYSIIDEIDSILIDEARTPLIIANKSDVSIELFHITSMLVKSFQPDKEVEVQLSFRQVHLTEEGIESIQKVFGIDNIYSSEHSVLMHYINQSLQAQFILRKDVDYIVREGKIELVDAFTGRIMEGRNLSYGLHQALEAKEGVKINEENLTQASVTVQNYFRMYKGLSGMTGSALPAQKEFMDIYNLDVIEIPTNRPKLREDFPDAIYSTLERKDIRILAEVKKYHETGRPILIGTTSIHQSERISALLKKNGIPHELLNAKTEEQEARTISMAGQKGQITIATNMAGRGTDILLGEDVAKLGGLHILGTERHESLRIDMQLRGRAGRQGDPGSSQFIVSLEDDLLHQYDVEDLEKWTKKMKSNEKGEILSPDPQKFINKVQESIENQHFSGRVHLLKLEDVLNQQRKTVYEMRNSILLSKTLTDTVLTTYNTVYQDILDTYLPDEVNMEDWEFDRLHAELSNILPLSLAFEELSYKERYQIEALVSPDLQSYKQDIAMKLQQEQAVYETRQHLLNQLDLAWVEHLDIMEELKDGIHLRSYAQEDPYRLFQMEGYKAFQETLHNYHHSVAKNLYNLYNRTEEMEDTSL